MIVLYVEPTRFTVEADNITFLVCVESHAPVTYLFSSDPRSMIILDTVFFLFKQTILFNLSTATASPGFMPGLG